MRISLLCTDENHPVNSYLSKWIENNNKLHHIELVRRKDDLSGGEILFLISCSEILNVSDRSNYKSCLILHASDLPKGRGWSPHIWQIIEGAEKITVSLIEAEDKVDSGRIWKKLQIQISKYALWDEINARLFVAEIELIDYAVRNFDKIIPQFQDQNIQPSYYTRRELSDSRIDPTLSIASQFNQLRVCDPHRFPAFFELDGYRYKISLEKLND